MRKRGGKRPPAGLVKDIERQATNLLAVLVADQNGIVPISDLRLLSQHMTSDRISAVHRLDVVGQFDVTGSPSSV